MTTYATTARERLEEEVQATLWLVACTICVTLSCRKALLCPPLFASFYCILVSIIRLFASSSSDVLLPLLLLGSCELA